MKHVLLAIPLLLISACAKSDATAEVKTTTAVSAGSAEVRFATDTAGASNTQDQGTLDARITLHVQQALSGDKTTAADAKAIRVTSLDGAVALHGFVSTDVVKSRSTLLAQAVGSVASVDNQLVVDPDAVKNDQPIETPVDRLVSDRVRMALLDDRTTAAEARTVGIVTVDGVVHLSGQVSSEAVRQRMHVVANAVGSVKRIVNELTVKAL